MKHLNLIVALISLIFINCSGGNTVTTDANGDIATNPSDSSNGINSYFSLSSALVLAKTSSEIKKIDTLSGALSSISLTDNKAKEAKGSGKGHVVIKTVNEVDASQEPLFIFTTTENKELKLDVDSLDKVKFDKDGNLYFVSKVDNLIYRKFVEDSIPEKLTQYPWDSMSVSDVSGSAIDYQATVNDAFTKYVFWKNMNFVHTSKFLAQVGDSGLLFDIPEDSMNNFKHIVNGQIVNSRIENPYTTDISYNDVPYSHPLYTNGGALWQSAGVVIFGGGNNPNCAVNTFGIMYVRESDLVASRIGCTPVGYSSNTNNKYAMLDGEYFVMKGTSSVWAYSIDGNLSQKILDFAPVNMALSGTTLWYDSMDANGQYVYGKIDIVTGEEDNFNSTETISDFITLQRN